MANGTPPPPIGAETQAPGVQPAPQKRSWFARNWGWVLGCGCLSVILAGVGIFVLLFVFVFSALKNNPVCRQAMQQVQNSPEARELLGTPIESGMLISGQFNVNNGSGNANLSIPVSGPKGEGTLRVRATRSGGQWTLQSLTLETPSNAPVDLLSESGPETLEAPQGRSAPPPDSRDTWAIATAMLVGGT